MAPDTRIFKLVHNPNSEQHLLQRGITGGRLREGRQGKAWWQTAPAQPRRPDRRLLSPPCKGQPSPRGGWIPP